MQEASTPVETVHQTEPSTQTLFMYLDIIPDTTLLARPASALMQPAAVGLTTAMEVSLVCCTATSSVPRRSEEAR